MPDPWPARPLSAGPMLASASSDGADSVGSEQREACRLSSGRSSSQVISLQLAQPFGETSTDLLRTCCTRVSSCWANLRGYASKLWSLIIWSMMLMSFMVANFMLPVVCGIQMLILDYVLAGESLTKHPWVWLFCVCELCLVVHLVVNNTPMQTVRSGSFQWITYSWLISLKCCLLYFRVLPDLQVKEVDFAEGSFMSTRTMFTILGFTPMFYTILTFRTLRELVQSGNFRHSRSPRPRKSQRSLQREMEEYTRLDVVLLTDMVWHVFMDMIDIFYMMFMSNPYDDNDSIMDPEFMKERPETVKHIRRAVGIFVFLGLFLHQHSFPRFGYRAPPKQETQTARQSGFNPVPRTADYSVDVVKARKRSAIVSILVVDLPFLVIRTYVYMLSVNTTQSESLNHSPLHGILPQMDKWWMKNILCLVLQAMQLRFVQQADLERSSSLCGWDVQITVSRAKAAAFGARRLRPEYSRELRKKWHELDRGKLQAAMEDTGTVFASDRIDRPPSDLEQQPMGHWDGLHLGEPRMTLPAVPQRRGSCDTSGSRQSPPQRSRCLGCCSRRPCRCCSCDCSSGILMHALMGSLLGWMIAKVDFTQVVTDIVAGLGPEGSSFGSNRQ